MGLGKTLQALALFCRVREQGGAGPFLVVAPTSVVTNWAGECARFAPDLVGLPVTSTVARGKVPIAEIAVGGRRRDHVVHAAADRLRRTMRRSIGRASCSTRRSS